MFQGPILCVDDEPVNLALMRDVLRDDHRLMFANSGEGAIDCCMRQSPGLILMDVDMPGMDGLATARRLKDTPETANVPIIFVTARGRDADEEAGFEVGAVDYITKPINPRILKARVSAHLSLVKSTVLESSYRAAIYMLGEAGHYNDTDTGMHIWRMASFARLLAQAVGWSKERAQLLEMAAPMHDMGKIGVPDSVLKKPGPLTSDEWVLMRQHTVIGHDILKRSDAPVFQLAAEVAMHHHEKWSGGGYPLGIAGQQIPESARIVAVVDIFDALSMKRPYKEAWPLERVISTLKDMSGPHLEPRLVDAFLNIMAQVLEEKERWDSQETPRMADAHAAVVA